MLDQLEKKRAAARAGGGEDKLDARRKKGLMTARDRLDELFQAGTFQEWGMHADHDCHNFGMEEKSLAWRRRGDRHRAWWTAAWSPLSARTSPSAAARSAAFTPRRSAT